ncbi:MAG: DUF2461 domain-containing protein [Bacteroidetes bacterium]|nr:DUF2461 domain-containing protein [Bacteroidota bacterium]
MLQVATLEFLKSLSQNNEKAWFDAHRHEYVQAKSDFELFVGNTLEGLAAIDSGLAEVKAKDCIFRIFRDVRFSKDKTPYKTHFGAYLSRGGRKFSGAGYYLHIEAGGKSMGGGGLWMPEPSLLKKVRQEIDYNFEAFQAIIQARSFKKYFSAFEGEKLKSLPQGYTSDNPAIEYLKLKNFATVSLLPDQALTDEKGLHSYLEIFSALKPLVDFLNKALD